MATAAAKMLKNKVALVTGSTSGIGAAIAKSLARAGANVVLHGLVPTEAEKLVIQKKFEEETGSKAVVSTHNISKTAEVTELVNFASKQLGQIDILVNNAGIQHVSSVEAFPFAKWDEVIATNLTSCFQLTQLTLPAHAMSHTLTAAGMRERKFGRIINIASVHGLVASANKSAYVAAKHGLVGLTKVVALETAGSGVTCNAICPGWVLTPLVRAQVEKRAKETNKPMEVAMRELLIEKQPSGEFVEPEDLGELAVFLSSKHAAQMTGITLPMDGGWTAQ